MVDVMHRHERKVGGCRAKVSDGAMSSLRMVSVAILLRTHGSMAGARGDPEPVDREWTYEATSTADDDVGAPPSSDFPVVILRL